MYRLCWPASLPVFGHQPACCSRCETHCSSTGETAAIASIGERRPEASNDNGRHAACAQNNSLRSHLPATAFKSAFAEFHADADSHANPDANTNTDANTNFDANINTDANPDANTNPDADADTNPDADTNADADENSNSNRHAKANSRSDRRADSHAETHRDCSPDDHSARIGIADNQADPPDQSASLFGDFARIRER